MFKRKPKSDLITQGDKALESFQQRQSAEYLSRQVPAIWQIINLWHDGGLSAEEMLQRAAESFRTAPPAEVASHLSYINERLLKRIEYAAQFLEAGGQLEED